MAASTFRLVYDYIVLEAYAVLRVLLFDEERNGRQAQHAGYRPDPSLLIESTDRKGRLGAFFFMAALSRDVRHSRGRYVADTISLIRKPHSKRLHGPFATKSTFRIMTA